MTGSKVATKRLKKGKTGVSSLLGSVAPSTIALLFIASAAIVVLSFAVPLTALQVYDRVIANCSKATLAWLCLGCFAALALNAFLEHWRSCLCAWAAARYALSMDERLAAAILDASPETVGQEDEARHMERFRGLSGTAGAVLARFLPVAAEAPFALAYLALLSAIGAEIALVPAIAAGAELLVALAARPLYAAIIARAEGAERSRTGYLGFALRRIHFVKAQALEQATLGVFEREQADETSALAGRAALDRRLDEFGRMVNGAASFGIMLWGGSLIASGRLTYGAVSAGLFFASRLVGIARDMRKGLFLLTDAREGLAEQARGLERERRPGAGEPPLPRMIQGRLEFEGVGLALPGTEAISGLSFIVRPGEAALVLGATPAGRSAVCRLAAGILSPGEGHVLLDAYPSSRWDFLSSPGAIGYVSSRSSVLPGSLIDNIAAFDPSRREAALDVAQVFGLDAIVSRLPRGFETQVGPNDSGGLSASSLRLVTVARAMTRRPRLLVWDEADADLDAGSSRLCVELLSELRGSMGLIINSASPAFRALARIRLGRETER